MIYNISFASNSVDANASNLQMCTILPEWDENTICSSPVVAQWKNANSLRLWIIIEFESIDLIGNLWTSEQL